MSESTFDPVADPLPDAEPGYVDDSPQSGLPEGDWQVSDVSGDGLPDTAVQQLLDGGWTALVDVDGDLDVDSFVIDADGDGRPEIVVSRDGDGYRLQIDGDGDGVFEQEQTMTRAELEAIDPTVVQALDADFGTADTTTDSGFPVAEEPAVVDGQLVDDPPDYADNWFEQSANGFCVPSSVAQIVSEYSGVDYTDEQAFVAKANELHLFTVGPDGVPSMSLDGALELLEDSGVPAGIDPHGTLEKLEQFRAEDRGIILAIDSGEIWGTEAVEDNAADHAVVLERIDREAGVAVLSDPGQPGGNQFEVPLDALVDAWDDAGDAMIVTDVAPSDETRLGVPGWKASPTTDGLVSQPVDLDPVPEPAPLPFGNDITPVFDPSVVSLDSDEGVVDSVVSFVGHHPYVLLPVVLGVGAGVRAIGRKQ